MTGVSCLKRTRENVTILICFLVKEVYYILEIFLLFRIRVS